MYLNKFNQINVLVGENGSGKSRTLSQLAYSFIESDDENNVICIANTAKDKFKRVRNRKDRYSLTNLKNNSIDYIFKKTINRVFLETQNSKVRSLIANSLEYIGFSDQVICTPFINPEFSRFSHLRQENPDIENEINEIERYLTKNIDFIKKEPSSFNRDGEDFVFFPPKIFHRVSTVKLNERINFNSDFFDDIKSRAIFLIIKNENILIKSGLLTKIKLFIIKEDHVIDILNISSGESSALISYFFIAFNIKENTKIFIDEPENSLHPRWQKEYIEKLLDLYYLFSPQIFVATHSPMIVIGAEEQSQHVSLFHVKNSNLIELNSHNETNIEEVMVDIFGVLTSRSRYFSYKVNQILNDYSNNKLTKNLAIERSEELRKLGIDEKQSIIIDNMENILGEIKNNG